MICQIECTALLPSPLIRGGPLSRAAGDSPGQLPQGSRHGSQPWSGARARHDQQVDSRGQIGELSSKRLSQQSLPTVPLDRLAQPSRDRQAQPRMVQSVVGPIYQQHVIAGRDAVSVKPLELGTAAKSSRWSKCLPAVFCSRVTGRRMGGAAFRHCGTVARGFCHYATTSARRGATRDVVHRAGGSDPGPLRPGSWAAQSATRQTGCRPAARGLRRRGL